MTNFGAHHLDIAQWGLGMDDSGPVSIEGTGTFPKEKHLCEVTDTCKITYTYANGVKVVLVQPQRESDRCAGGNPATLEAALKAPAGGVIFYGDKGRPRRSPADPGSKPELLKPNSAAATRGYVSKDHYQNFLDCIKSRQKPIADVEIGHRTATVCHLGNMAVRLGRKIEWDPAKEQIVGDADAATSCTTGRTGRRGSWRDRTAILQAETALCNSSSGCVGHFRPRLASSCSAEVAG